jgi:hypothetical protein
VVNCISISCANHVPNSIGGPAIPEKYGAKSELKVEVKVGSNTLDFNLEPAKPGEAVSPPQAD